MPSAFAPRWILALLVTVGPAVAEVRCPALLQGHRYEHASVFDGPPEEQADLGPDEGKRAVDIWRIGGLYGSGRLPYVVCRYAGTAAAVTEGPSLIVMAGEGPLSTACVDAGKPPGP